MNEQISLLAAIIWVVVSGLVGVGIGICIMCLCFVSRENRSSNGRAVYPSIKPCGYLSDLAKGKSVKENMK